MPDRDTPAAVFVADDVDRAWDEIGEYLLHDARMYAEWNPDNKASAGISPAHDVAELRATSKSHRIFSVEEAVKRASAGEMLNLSPLCGGLPPALAWPYLKRVAELVLPEAAQANGAVSAGGLGGALTELMSTKGIGMTGTNAVDLYYDPFDFDIDDDPYPSWKRLRDDAPLYYNEKFDFYALSRYEDVSRELPNFHTYRSGRGTTIDIIMSGIEVPPGVILFEDPPLHDLHRRLLSKVFTPRRMEAIEPLTRQYCVRALDPLVGSGRFDFIEDLGAQVPMRTIGYLLGIPEGDQETIRDATGQNIGLQEGTFKTVTADAFENSYQLFADYIDWRADHPSDDVMTQLLNAEIEENGVHRPLTRTEVLTYTSMIAGAGNETTTRLIGFIGQLLAEHPDQRRQLVDDFSLIPRAIEEVLRYEAPSPVQARYVAHDTECRGEKIPEGSVMLLLNGSANRDERHFPDGERFDIHRSGGHLSFGQGLHFCLGSALARMQARVALEEILTRWPEWHVDYDKAAMAHTSSVRGWGGCPSSPISGRWFPPPRATRCRERGPATHRCRYRAGCSRAAIAG